MKTYYLIDYENVNCDGLKGCNKLKKSDLVIIFFTKNASKINMLEIANHGDAKLQMIEIPTGKQSADMHIASYLGYLARKENSKNCRIAIISKDTDFDHVIKFWNSRTGMKISRISQIVPTVSVTAHIRGKSTAKKTELKKNYNESQRINTEIMQLLSKAGFENLVIGFVASTVIKNLNSKDKKQQICKIIVEKYGESLGLDICSHIKNYM